MSMKKRPIEGSLGYWDEGSDVANDYLDKIEALEAAEGDGRQQQLDQLESELPQIQEVLDWLASQGEGRRGLKITNGLEPLWRRKGYSEEGVRWLRLFLTYPFSPMEDELVAQGKILQSKLTPNRKS